MGDVGAVTVIQEAHTRFLQARRILRADEMIGGSPSLDMHTLLGDVFIDDLVLLALGGRCEPPGELLARLDCADEAYKAEGLPVKDEKGSAPATQGTFWGASLASGGTRVGFSLERRASLAGTTLLALAHGVSGASL
eukprot:7281458-Lingulodinium_polyedra.AAC.1